MAAGREEYSAFVGDIAPEVTDAELLQVFQARYASVFSAKVVKGFGFVRFSNEGERDRAIGEMQGFVLADRPLRMSLATEKRGGRGPGGGGDRSVSHEVTQGDFDPNNTTLFIGGLATTVTEPEVNALFARFGQIVYVRIPPGKGCGFVQFTERAAAVLAMQTLHGHMVHGAAIRISWGKNSNKQQSAPPPQPAYPADASALQHYHSHDGSWAAHGQQDYSHWGAWAPYPAGYGYEGGDHAHGAHGSQDDGSAGRPAAARVQSTFGSVDPRDVDVAAHNRSYMALHAQRWQPNAARLAFPPSHAQERTAPGLKGTLLSSACG